MFIKKTKLLTMFLKCTIMFIYKTNERRKAMKKWYKIIDELTVLTGKLIRLALEIGTLISVIHMILQSIK